MPSKARAKISDYDVTIVARNMPGDPPSLAWASPWAGAIFLGVDGCTPEQAKMQADSFERLWQLAEESPESSVRVSHSTGRDYLIVRNADSSA